MLNERIRRSILWLAVVVWALIAIGIVTQIVNRAVVCKDIVCQLRYASIYTSTKGLPLAAIVMLQVILLSIVLAVLQAKPLWLKSVGRFCIAITCLSASLLALRIALIETLLLHAWSRACVAASWMSVILFGLGIVAVLLGYPRTRVNGGIALIAAIGVGTLSWYLMQQGGFPKIFAQNVDPRVLVSTHNYSLGPESAKLQIVEFADFRCPPCRRVAPELQTLVEKYHGSIRLIQRELPNERLHPHAERAAEIAECFGEQGKFWEVAADLYKNASIPDDKALEAWITHVGVNGPQLRACMAEHRSLSSIAQDRKDAHALGLTATPTLFIGNRVLEGATSMDKLDGFLRSQIANPGQAISPVDPHLLPSTGCSVQEPDSNGTANENEQAKNTGRPCS